MFQRVWLPSACRPPSSTKSKGHDKFDRGLVLNHAESGMGRYAEKLVTPEGVVRLR